MDSPRSHITEREHKARRNLPRCAQVPLHHITSLWGMFDIACGEICSVTSRFPKCFRRKRTGRENVRDDALRKRSHVRRDQPERVGQRQHVKNAETTAKDRLAVCERGPGEPNAWLEVPQRRVQKVRRAQACLGIGHLKQVREPAVRLAEDCGHLVAQACVEGQIPPQTYIVLNVCAEERLARPKHWYGNGYKSNKISRPVDQEFGER